MHWALATRVRADRDVSILPRRAGQWLDPAVSLREKGWQTGFGIDATMPDEEYRFWGEKPPRTVDDPEIVEKVLKKWGAKLSWVKSAPPTQSVSPEGKRRGKKGVRSKKPTPSRGVM